MHLLPQGFSFTTTITLSAMCSGSLVKYSKIDYRVRTGQSKIRPVHAFDFMLLIIRTIVYFSPLKIFLPAGMVFFVGGIAKFIYDIYIGNLSESALLGCSAQPHCGRWGSFPTRSQRLPCETTTAS